MLIAQIIILAGLCFGDGRVYNPTLRFNESCSELDKDNAKTCEDSCMSQFDDCIDRSLEPDGKWSEYYTGNESNDSWDENMTHYSNHFIERDDCQRELFGCADGKRVYFSN